MAKVIGGGWAMVEPLEEVAPGEKTLVETSHDFGI